MYMIQLAYYSLIPIGILNSVSILSEKSMKYVSGWNPLFGSSTQAAIPNNYSMLSIKSNFLSNLNLMLMPVFLFLIVSLCLYIAHKKSNHYSFKPRLFILSLSFLLEFPLALLLFNTFNIYSSLVVDLQYLNTQDIPSLIVSILSATLLPITITLMNVYQKHFTEFNKEISEVDLIWKIDQRKSTIIRKLYPLAISIEITLVSIFLSIESLFGIGLYLSLGIIILMSAYIMISTPYTRQMENLRLLIYRFIILLIICLQVYTKIEIMNGK